MAAFTPYTPTAAASAAPNGGPSVPPIAPVAASSSFIPYTPGQTAPVPSLPAVASAPTAPTASSQTPNLSEVPGSNNSPSSYFGAVGAAFNNGVQQIKSAFGSAPSRNPIVGLERGAQVGAGAATALTAPLAPLFSPVAKAVSAVGNQVSNIPLVQKFANSTPGAVTSRVAQDVSNVDTIAGFAAGGEGSAPVEGALDAAASKTGSAAGSLASQGLGMTTGAGASSIKAAFNGSQAFTDALRGNVSPDDVIESAENAVQNIADTRRTAYQAQLSKLGENTKSLDISSVHQTLGAQLQNFGVKVNDDGSLDFSRSSIANNGTARSDIQGVYDTLKGWGTQPGDRTAVGLDTLKKQLTDFYSQSGSARALVQAVKGKVSNILQDQVPGYAQMTKGYAQASQLLDDIKSATGVGGKARADTIFTKLTTAMKSDNAFRLEMMNELQSKGAQPDLMDQIAGINLSSLVPKGLVGKGADVGAAFAVIGHYFQPQYIPMLLATSPRLVGEFARTLGMGKNSVSAIVGAVNKVAGKITTGSLATAPVSSLAQAQTPANQ